MFIKHGGNDGEITHIIEGNDLTDDQKTNVKKVAEQLAEKSSELADSSSTKKMEN